MGRYRDSEENICLKARELLDGLSSHPGSEYQFANGCLDVFREFFKSLGADSVSHPVFIQLYKNYQQVVDSYRGKIDISKIERSFSALVERNGVNLDDLASGVSLQKRTLKKIHIKGGNGSQYSTSYTFTNEYARKLDYEKWDKEKKDREATQKNGRKNVIEIVEEDTRTTEEREAITKIRKENYSYVHTSLTRVKGLHNILFEIYEGCKLSDDGEFTERFIEDWLDFRREVVFLREWLEYNWKTGSFAKVDQEERQRLINEVGESIDKYDGSPQLLFEKSRVVSSFPQLESIFEEIDSQVGELV